MLGLGRLPPPRALQVSGLMLRHLEARERQPRGSVLTRTLSLSVLFPQKMELVEETVQGLELEQKMELEQKAQKTRFGHGPYFWVQETAPRI